MSGAPGARGRILGDIRRSLGREAPSRDARDELARKLKRHRPNLVPERARLPHGAQVELFVEMAEASGATLARVAALDQVPGAVADYLAAHNLGSELVAAPDPALEQIPWAERPMLSLRRGKAEPADAVSLTPAFAAIAESGTLMLISGAESPSTLNFLPESHLVVLRAEDVVGALEEAWERLRKRPRRGRKFAMPRTVNLITGPSRSGDIGLKLILGAHGPRRLHIVLVDDAAGDS
jgi:L-lactate dehydrogenase complex protein LldG